MENMYAASRILGSFIYIYEIRKALVSHRVQSVDIQFHIFVPMHPLSLSF